MKLPIYCISDSHFSILETAKELDRQEKMFLLFKKIKSTGGTLIIGGDFFDFWFDYNSPHLTEYNSLIYELNQLSKSGIEIHYILGNHDYWDFGSFEKKFNAITYQNNLVTDINDKKILITHGDGLLSGDKGYRFMKKIIRSTISIILFRMLGKKIGYKLATRVSNTSAQYHHHDQHSNEIISEITSKMDNIYSGHFDFILVGHYHQIGIFDINNTKIIFMGDWLTKFTVTTFDGELWSQKSWDN